MMKGFVVSEKVIRMLLPETCTGAITMMQYQSIPELTRTMTALELLGYVGIVVGYLYFWVLTAKLLYSTRDVHMDPQADKGLCIFLGFFWLIFFPITLIVKLVWYLAFGKDK